jgi:Rrf2 family cysteine metabolism transcriptional repressor
VDNPELYLRSDHCVTHDIWAEVKKAMDGVLESTTFEDLVERQKHKGT